MINKKAGFDLQSFLIVFILFIGIMVTFGTVAVNMTQNYNPLTGNNADQSFINTYDKLNTIEQDTEDIENKVVDTQTGSQDSGTEFLGDALNSLKLIVPSLQTITAMIEDMANTIGIPVIWFRIMSLIIILMVLTVIIFMIFRYR